MEVSATEGCEDMSGTEGAAEISMGLEVEQKGQPEGDSEDTVVSSFDRPTGGDSEDTVALSDQTTAGHSEDAVALSDQTTGGHSEDAVVLSDQTTGGHSEDAVVVLDQTTGGHSEDAVVLLDQTTGGHSEDAVVLSDQTTGGELPTNHMSKSPGSNPFTGERLSKEGSVEAEEDRGPEVLDPAAPELERQHPVDGAPPEQLEKQELRINQEEQQELLHDLQVERNQLNQMNTQLQAKLADYFRRKMGEDSRPEQVKGVADLQQRYQKYLETLEELKWQRGRDSELQRQQAEELRQQSQEKLEQVEQEWSSLLERKYELVVTALSRKQGKQAAQVQAEQLKEAERKREGELVAIRLENIKLKMMTRRMEAELKAKEELAEGLHLIDFEQLKIENQTYNEKIEERKEELLKLRKKITNTVQVLTHVKEKLQFVQVQNQTKRAQLAELDAAVARKRDILTRTKQARDGLRADNLRLRQRCGLLGNTTLLRDMEDKVDASEGLERRLEMLKRRHAELTLRCAGVKKKLEQSMLKDD